jgi:hypothetical protein
MSVSTELGWVPDQPRPGAGLYRPRSRQSGRRRRAAGITERAAHRVVAELAAAGYLTRQRNGRRNSYAINAHLPLPDPNAREQNIGELLEILTATHPQAAG